MNSNFSELKPYLKYLFFAHAINSLYYKFVIVSITMATCLKGAAKDAPQASLQLILINNAQF